MKRDLIVAIMLASAAARADEVDDPRVLFAEGRYAAAAQVFEHRWTAKGDATDGVNAVVAWRTAGRYARAASLLARVRSGKQQVTGETAATADELAERLANLTAIATIEGTLDRNAVIRIDADPAERIGDSLVIDVGEHDIEIDQPGCERFVWRAAAYPGAKLVVPFRPRCDQSGTLHLYLATEPGAEFRIDGVAHRATGHEADVKLEPGEHRVEIAAHDRPVYDERVTIRSRETEAVRIRYPWRARKLGIVLGVTTELRAGQHLTGIGLALTAGLWAPSFHYMFDAGAMISNGKDLDPTTGTPGRPWIGNTLVIHTPRSPVWHGKLGPYRVAFDPQPLGIRFDEIRAISYAGIRACEENEARVRAFSALPVALSADGPYMHGELTLWPISRIYYHPANGFCGDGPLPSETGWGTFVTFTGGWRL